jgi:hypothetical protein
MQPDVECGAVARDAVFRNMKPSFGVSTQWANPPVVSRAEFKRRFPRMSDHLERVIFKGIVDI